MLLYSSIRAALRLRIRNTLLPFFGIAAFSLIGIPVAVAADVDLAWDTNPDEEKISGYRIHLGITSRHYEQTNDVGNASSATLENLGNGVRYFVALTAYNQDGVESEYSDEFEFTTSAVNENEAPDEDDAGAEAPNDDEEDPDAGSEADGGEIVEGILPKGNSTAELIWNANPEEDDVAGYRLYYGTTSGSYPAMLDTGNSTSITVTGLAENTAYFVVLTAYNKEGLESPPSEEFQFLSSTNLPPEIILTRVGSGTISALDGNMVLLATARDEDGFVSRVDFYDGTRLLHSDEDFPYALRISGLEPGLHQLRAVAVDDWGEAAESAPLRVQVGSPLEAPEPKTLSLTLAPPINGRTPLFTITAPPGSLVQLEASVDLNDWDVVSESRADDFGNVEITDPTPEDELPDQRFYRVVTP